MSNWLARLADKAAAAFGAGVAFGVFMYLSANKDKHSYTCRECGGFTHDTPVCGGGERCAVALANERVN